MARFASKEAAGASPPLRQLTLIVRAYCHLCDEMRAAVLPLAKAAGCPVHEIDVDTDSALEARWGERVPVLLGGVRELCHYRVDRAALSAWLGSLKRLKLRQEPRASCRSPSKARPRQ